MMRLRFYPLHFALLALVVVALGSTPRPAVQATAVRTPPVHLSTLDGGKLLLPSVTITAVAFAPHHTVYATGLYWVKGAARAPQSVAQDPESIASVWLVSHDEGAHWLQRVSTPHLSLTPPAAVTALPPWRDHTHLPIGFAAKSIAVDPHNPRIIYLGGCTYLPLPSGPPYPETGVGGSPTDWHRAVSCTTATQDRFLLRSLDGGRTWSDVLWIRDTSPTWHMWSLYPHVTRHDLDSNIRVTPFLLRRLNLAYWPAGICYALAIDPSDDKHIYAATNLGLLDSRDHGRKWQYGTQPYNTTPIPIRGGSYVLGDHREDELQVDPRHTNVIYDLSHPGIEREQFFYRSTDSGASWRLIPSPWPAHTTAWSLMARGREIEAMLTSDSAALFAGDMPGTAGPFDDPRQYARFGVFGSHDQGMHWQQETTTPILGGKQEQTLRSRSGWLTLFYGRAGQTIINDSGLYARRDGHKQWHLVVKRYGGRDIWTSDRLGATKEYQIDPQLWEDPRTDIVFLARPLGGLRRWISNV